MIFPQGEGKGVRAIHDSITGRRPSCCRQYPGAVSSCSGRSRSGRKKRKRKKGETHPRYLSQKKKRMSRPLSRPGSGFPDGGERPLAPKSQERGKRKKRRSHALREKKKGGAPDVGNLHGVMKGIQADRRFSSDQRGKRRGCVSSAGGGGKGHGNMRT